MKSFHSAAALMAAVLSLSAAPAVAQIPDDVAMEIVDPFTKYKSGKNGSGSVQFSALTVFVPFSGNYRQQASGVVNFYISTDTTIDESDRLIGSRGFKIKGMRGKLLKFKATLAPDDRGRYIIGEVISAQDGWLENNVVNRYIFPHFY